VQYLITRDSIWTAKAARATVASMLKAIWTDTRIRTIESKYTEFSPRVEAQLRKMPNLWAQVEWYFE